MTVLDKIITEPKTGEERLSCNNQQTEVKLIDFWRWSVSDLVSNATRGRFGEFIVATALKIDLTVVRDEWSAYDLTSPEGIKIEVKSASYLQSWFQINFSLINFSIKTARHWNSLTNKQGTIPVRHSDVYVFCVLKHKEQATINPLNLDQWEFYVVATSIFNNYTKSRSSITLQSLQKLTPPVMYEQLRQAIIESTTGINSKVLV